MINDDWYQKFPVTGAGSYYVERVGRKLRLFLWTAVLFTESATIYSVLLLAHLHHWA
jgi:hypothetical protein